MVSQFLPKNKQKKSTRGMIVVKSNYFVLFLGELRIAKIPFEINWPLLNDRVSSCSYFHNWVYFTLQLALYKNPSIIQKKGKNDDVSLNYYNCFKNRVISIWFIIFWKEVPIWIWLLVVVLQLHHPPLQFWQWPGLPPAIKIRNPPKVG